MIKITYIGKRAQYVEGCYGSKILFVRGESQMVPRNLAMKLLRHVDQFVEGGIEDLNEEIADDSEHSGDSESSSVDSDSQDMVDDTPVAEVSEPDDLEDDIQDLRDSVASLDKDGLASFAHKHFNGFKLDGRKAEDTLRLEVVQMIDQYGIS